MRNTISKKYKILESRASQKYNQIYTNIITVCTVENTNNNGKIKKTEVCSIYIQAAGLLVYYVIIHKRKKLGVNGA